MTTKHPGRHTGNLRERQKAGDMYRRITSVIVGALVSIGLTSSVLASPAYAQEAQGQQQVAPGEKVEAKGMILTRDGDQLVLETKDKGNVNVVINPETKVQVPKGVFRKKDMETTALMPGLEVQVKGVAGENGQVTAGSILFTNESLKVAKQAHAAMTATNAQVAANQQGVEQNRQGVSQNQQSISANAANIGTHEQKIAAAEKRFDDLTEFDTKKTVTINFATGKSTLPDDSKQQLTELAKDAQGIKGYLIEVKGFASTSGGAARNQQLSEDRAEEVVTFLHQQGITIQHIVNPAAMGTTTAVADNDTEEGRKQNQRVEVKLLVNKGLNAQ